MSKQSAIAVVVLVIVAATACDSQRAALPTANPSTTSSSTSVLAIPSTSSSTVPSTTPPTPTTATTFQPRCRPDPFPPGTTGTLQRRYPGIEITAHVKDLNTGCQYTLFPDSRQRTASVFKVMVLAGTLLEAQNEERDLTDLEMSRLTPMITQSANDPVRALWRSFGASPWFRETGAMFGLNETSITADGGSAWGATRTSASDQVDLLGQVLLGDGALLDEQSRGIAFDLMTSVVPDQTWGVTADVPHSWVVAQKNGFAGSIINSVGWVDPPGPERGYLVAILTDGWPNHSTGIAAVEHINQLITAVMVDMVEGAT